MKFVIFGLTISSSWGNGHATLLRGLFRALVRRGHRIVFFERDVPYYAENRDITSFEGVKLRLFSNWQEAAPLAVSELRDADVGIVTSYCFDGLAASDLVCNSAVPRKIFYDLDTPVTLAELRSGESLSYVGARGFEKFDLVLSYTGGAALDALQTELRAKAVAPLYGSVDPNVHHRTEPREHYRSDLSYIGTYAEDRQAALETLFVEPARLLPGRKFTIAGAKYPGEFPWSPNIFFVKHLPPQEHAAFYSSSRITLNVTRRSMAALGYCPSGRFFEAACCGTPILSDSWEGLEEFFEPGAEILIGNTVEDAVNAVSFSDAELDRYARAAYERVMACHTADRRATELEQILEDVSSGNSPGRQVLGNAGSSIGAEA